MLIVKRHAATASGGALAGLDDLEKLARSGTPGAGGSGRKAMTFKGMVDIDEIVATDVGRESMCCFVLRLPSFS